MRILINTPELNVPGGVSNHYAGLRKFWTEQVKYNFIGSRKVLPGWIVFPFDLVIYIFNIISFKPHIIILNPSMGVKAIRRDYFYFRIAFFFGIKPVIFIHGWDQIYVDKLSLKPDFIKEWFNKASCILVLSSDFRDQIKRWNVTTPIYLTTTKVDDEYLKEFDISFRDGVVRNLLFLSRVEENKGIFITLKSFKMLKEKYPQIKLVIAGSGGSLEEAKQFVAVNCVEDVNFCGFVSGKNLIDVFKTSDLYILPTYSEGMPTSVLEAMAFGLPVITRPVGGLNDFFENDKMGYLIESTNPIDYYDAIEKLLLNVEKCKEISIYNNLFARENFMASQIARNIENLCSKYK